MSAVEAIDHARRAEMPAEAPKPENENAQPAVSLKVWLAVIGSTFGAFLPVLNIQIVNFSLADIQGAIGAGIDGGGSVSNSHLVSQVIVSALSCWLSLVIWL